MYETRLDTMQDPNMRLILGVSQSWETIGEVSLATHNTRDPNIRLYSVFPVLGSLRRKLSKSRAGFKDEHLQHSVCNAAIY